MNWELDRGAPGGGLPGYTEPSGQSNDARLPFLCQSRLHVSSGQIDSGPEDGSAALE